MLAVAKVCVPVVIVKRRTGRSPDGVTSELPKRRNPLTEFWLADQVAGEDVGGMG
jgi:hypothetical protein